MKTVKRIARLLSPKRSGSTDVQASPSEDGPVSRLTQPAAPGKNGLGPDLAAFHAKLAPIKCTPADPELDDGEEPVLLRASYYHKLHIAERPAFSADQPSTPDDTAVTADDSPPRVQRELLAAVAAEGPENKTEASSSAAASPTARTPPTAPRVRAIKRLMQVKNRPPSPMPTAGELARGAVRPILAPLQHKSCTLPSVPAIDGKGLVKGTAVTASSRRMSRFAAAGTTGSENVNNSMMLSVSPPQPVKQS